MAFYTESGKLIDINLIVMIFISDFLNKSYLRQIDFAILPWKGGVNTIG